MKHAKKIISVIFAIMLFFSIVLQLTGCGKSSSVTTTSSTAKTTSTTTKTTTTTTSQLSNNTLVKTTDGSISLSVPSGWNTNDTALYPGAVIGVANDANSEYIIITKKPKSDIGTNSSIDDYMKVVTNGVISR
jgi:fructoselysine-6-P-deglycase FrlB-like protein